MMAGPKKQTFPKPEADAEKAPAAPVEKILDEVAKEQAPAVHKSGLKFRRDTRKEPKSRYENHAKFQKFKKESSK
jgi:hypothetical protein